MYEAQRIPLSDRLVPGHSKKGNVDISTSHIFWRHPTFISDLANLVAQHEGDVLVPFSGREVRPHVVLRVMLTNFQTLYNMWQLKAPLSDGQVSQCAQLTCMLGHTWRAFNWKPTVWVHWVIAHSAFFVKEYRSMYLFSSVPTEKRHQNFKLDLRHCFQGWRLSKTVLHHRGLVHVVNLSALDQGLRLSLLTEDPKNKKRLRW